MTGVPYCSVRVTGSLIVFRRLNAAAELIVERLLPIL